MAMAAGGFHDAFFTASWPTGEFGGMGLEGAVRHALKKELAAIADETEREATFQFFVKEAYARGKAINMASYMEIDAVIDPAETRPMAVARIEVDPGIQYPRPIPSLYRYLVDDCRLRKPALPVYPWSSFMIVLLCSFALYSCICPGL